MRLTCESFVDAIEALSAAAHYDEFVIASGDADMTPLLQRLRAADRRTTIVSPSDAAEAFLTVADRVLGAEQVLALVQGDAPEALEDALAEVEPTPDLSEFGPDLTEAEGVGDPSSSETDNVESVPEPLGRLSTVLALPRLASQTWPAIYATLAQYAATHHFHLNASTGWSRDQLKAQGVVVGRGAVGYVVRAASYGGAALHSTPSPHSDEIATAFFKNLQNRALAADLVLSEEEWGVVADWLGIPGQTPTTGAS